jgi:hypothetical protein
VLVAHASRDPCMRDVWRMPRPAGLRACEASDPAGHYTIPLLASVVSTLCHIPRRAPQLPTGKLRWLLDLRLPPNVSRKPLKQFPVFETKCRLPVPTARKQVHHADAWWTSVLAAANHATTRTFVVTFVSLSRSSRSLLPLARGCPKRRTRQKMSSKMRRKKLRV